MKFGFFLKCVQNLLSEKECDLIQLYVGNE